MSKFEKSLKMREKQERSLSLNDLKLRYLLRTFFLFFFNYEFKNICNKFELTIRNFFSWLIFNI